MNSHHNHKKKLIVSYKNLSDELKSLLKAAYPEGWTDFLQRTTKPNGEVIFVIPLETEDTTYMVKFDVKIDSVITEEEDHDLYDDEDKTGDEEFAPLSEAIDKDEDNVSHTERVVRHGSYDDILEKPKKRKKKEVDTDDDDEDYEDVEKLKQEIADLEEEEDNYDSYTDGEPDEYEPSDDDLKDIDMEFLADMGRLPEDEKPKEKEAQPQPRKRGRPRKNPQK